MQGADNIHANKKDRTQSSHQNQRRSIESNQENNRADLAESAAEQTVMFIGEAIANPAARSLNIEGGMPAAQMVRLHMQQTRTRHDKENDPRQSPRHAKARVKQFRGAKSEQNC